MKPVNPRVMKKVREQWGLSEELFSDADIMEHVEGTCFFALIKMEVAKEDLKATVAEACKRIVNLFGFMG
jgi:hypothetical protein